MSNELNILNIIDWETMATQLRKVQLKGDTNHYPYAGCSITEAFYNPEDLTPLALYTLQNRISETQELYKSFLKAGLDLFNLSGIVEFQYETDNIQKIAPPVVEMFYENAHLNVGRNGWKVGLVDGLHRCCVAQNLGIQKVKVIAIEGVETPLVPIACEWKDVKNYPTGAQLSSEEKRMYRYNTKNDVPENIAAKFNIKDENIKYFFYRDLSCLGSKGTRTFKEYKHD